MIDDAGGETAVLSPTAARQGVKGHNVRYVLGVSMIGVIFAFAAVALYLGAKLPL